MSTKFKPKKGVLKRCRVTGRGHFKMSHAGKSHKLSHKSATRRRRLRSPLIAAPCEEKRLRKMIGI